MQATLTAPATIKPDAARAAAQAAIQSLRAAGSDELATLTQGLHEAEALFSVAASTTDSVLLGREPTAAEERARDAASDASDAAADALREYPAQSFVELAEKARTLSEVRGCDDGDVRDNSIAVLADLERLAALAGAPARIMRVEALD